MNTADIRNGLKSTLDGASLGLSTAWPNVDYTGARPYAVVTVAPSDTRRGTLKGNEITVETGVFSAIVCVDENTGEAAAMNFADAIAALYPQGSRISITGGSIEILTTPSIRPGFTTEKEYRVPVVLTYRAVAT